MRNILAFVTIGGVLLNKGGGGGNLARELAAAPLKGNPAPDTAPADAPVIELSEQEKAEIAATTPAVENGNPFDAIFEGVTFSTAESDQVYTNDSSGMKSKKIGSFMAHLRGIECSIPGTIYARLPKGRTQAYVDVAFVGTARQSALKPHDEEAKLHLLAWKARTAGQFSKWRAAQNLNGVPAAATMMPAIDGINFGEAQSQ